MEILCRYQYLIVSSHLQKKKTKNKVIQTMCVVVHKNIPGYLRASSFLFMSH